MQTPDFWSIPFVSGPPIEADAPALLSEVFGLVVGGPAPPAPLRYDDALGEWWSAQGARGALSLEQQYVASGALGLLDDASEEP